jgi:hypothetical protein
MSSVPSVPSVCAVVIGFVQPSQHRAKCVAG